MLYSTCRSRESLGVGERDAQGLGLGIRQRTDCRPDLLGESGQEGRIDRVRLGSTSPARSPTVPHVARVDTSYGVTGPPTAVPPLVHNYVPGTHMLTVLAGYTRSMSSSEGGAGSGEFGGHGG